MNRPKKKTRHSLTKLSGTTSFPIVITKFFLSFTYGNPFVAKHCLILFGYKVLKGGGDHYKVVHTYFAKLLVKDNKSGGSTIK